MTTPNRAIPLPIALFAGLLTAVGLAAGVAQYLKPSGQFAGLVVTSGAVQAAVAELASRSLAQALALGLALALRERRALGLMFVMRAATETQDLIISLQTGIAPAPPAVLIAAFAVLFIGPELWAAATLLRRPKGSGARSAATVGQPS